MGFVDTCDPSRLRTCAAALALWITAGAAVAQEDGFGQPAAVVVGDEASSLQPLVDRIVGAAVGREAMPGAIVGVSWHGRRSYFGYSGTGERAYGPDTIVEIGSITKVFTTALFAEALADKRIERDRPIQSYLPDLRLHPCAAQITPLQLADFTSGLPTLPDDLPQPLAERGIDRYTREDFFAWLSRWTPAEGQSCEHPARYRYSNAGIGVLGYIVAEQLGASWQQLVSDRITGPLHMTSTAIEVQPEARDRLAPGYGVEGKPVMPWPVFAWFAAGALRSSASDMLAFGEAALGYEQVNNASVPPMLRQALQDAMQPIYQPEGQTFGQGMAWIQDTGDPGAGMHPVYLKDGGTDGFNSVIVINPGKDLAVFIAGSRPKSGIPKLGVALSRHIQP